MKVYVSQASYAYTYRLFYRDRCFLNPGEAQKSSDYQIHKMRVRTQKRGKMAKSWLTFTGHESRSHSLISVSSGFHKLSFSFSWLVLVMRGKNAVQLVLLMLMLE
jgi:hypothetical protein